MKIKIPGTLLLVLVIMNATWSQEPGAGENSSVASKPTAAGQSFSQDELNALLAPIALYPDALLSQVLMASTYPLEVVEADRFLKQNQGLQGDALDDALAKKNWDPSVQSLAAYPKVIAMMSEKLEWTERLGDAFLDDEGRLMDTVQALRRRAQAAGNLKSTNEQTVVQDKETIIIEPSQSDVVYVREDDNYDWLMLYGMEYGMEEYYYSRYYYGYEAGAYYGAAAGAYYGYAAGAYYGYAAGTAAAINSEAYRIYQNHWDWARADWQNRQFKLNPGNNRFWNQSGRTAPASGSAWQHDPMHRRGVDYPNTAMRDRFAGANPAAARSLEGASPPTSQGQPPQGPSASGAPGAGEPSPGGTPQPPNASPSAPMESLRGMPQLPSGGLSGGGMPTLPSGGVPGGGMPTLPSGGFPGGGMPGPPPGPPPFPH